jgi:carbamoyl-phosphate synthase large subunit
MTKSILIFGAGINQLELVREAKKLEIQTVVIDPSENPPGKVEADFYYQVEGKDYYTTKAIAIKHKVDGIVTSQMEKPMRLMARLGQELGLIFHSTEVVETSLDKVLMKQAFNRNSVPCAKDVVFKGGEEIFEDKIKGLTYPLIIKPADAFSSRGVAKVFSFEELKGYEEETRSYSSQSTIIVEEFLEGREFSVESITYKGKTTVIQVTEKFITPYPNTVEMAHLQPARITPGERTVIEAIVNKSILAIGIDNSASHAEVMLTKNGVFMIEIGARLGGDFISSYLTKSSTGISMDKASVQVALGIEPDLNQKFSKYSMIEYIKLDEGKTIKKLPDKEVLENMDGHVFSYYFLKEGDIIPKITHSAHRPICVLFEGNEEKCLLERLRKAKEILNSTIVLK